MNFLWSSLLALLVLLPILVAIYVWQLRRGRPSGVRYSSLALIRDAEPGSARLRRHLPVVLFIAALGAVIVAMARPVVILAVPRSEEHTSELQSRQYLVCRLLLDKKIRTSPTWAGGHRPERRACGCVLGLAP